jgi:hypothetical protein
MVIALVLSKQTHTAAAVNELGVEVAHLTALTRPVGNERL